MATSGSSQLAAGPREDYLEWDDYLMGIALLASQRSKDPVTQVGACIADKDKKIVGVGWNGMPEGLHDNHTHWNDLYVCHAAVNAILHSSTADLKGCTIYTTHFPCNACTKYLIQKGITDVAYYSDETDEKTGAKVSGEKPREMQAAREMLEKRGIRLTTKREDYMPWDDYFMGIAVLARRRSKHPETAVGACVAKEDRRIVGVGWNGMPEGLHDKHMPWNDLYVCHAAVNAVLHSSTADLKDCTMYTTLFPCNDCAKYLIQTRIKRVVYFSDKTDEKTGAKVSGEKPREMQAAREMLEKGIILTPYN